MSKDDRIAALLTEAGEGRPLGFAHYIYVPDRTNAESLAMKLRQDGFEVESRMGADEVNWLVLARHMLIPSEEAIERTSDQLTKLAESIGGEYDGWEADVTRASDSSSSARGASP